MICEQVWTGFNKSEQVWSTIFPQPWVACSPTLTYPQNLCAVFKSYFAQNSTTLQSGGNRHLSRSSWHKVWTGVKCNFSLAQLHEPYVVLKLSISRVRMWNFTRIECKTKKLWLSIIPARRRSDQPGLRPPQKGVNNHFSSPHLGESYVVAKISISEA